MDKLEFYVDDVLKHTETDIFSWLLAPWVGMKQYFSNTHLKLLRMMALLLNSKKSGTLGAKWTLGTKPRMIKVRMLPAMRWMFEFSMSKDTFSLNILRLGSLIILHLIYALYSLMDVFRGRKGNDAIVVLKLKIIIYGANIY